MKTYLITGATGGLGLKITEQLAADKNNRIIMLIRNIQKGMKTARNIGSNVEACQLDLSNLSDISTFIKSWDQKIHGLINNAGVQFVNETRYTPDGYEETIAVNHLAAFMLTLGLGPHLKGVRVLFIGSGTHNPDYPLSKAFGFRGAQYNSVSDLLKGNTTAKNIRQANRDRYCTSKLLNIMTAVELSKRYTDFSSFVLDPGLMPGAGLAREQGTVMQFMWKNIMPFMGLFMPDTSSPVRSAKTASWIMTTPGLEHQSGTVFSYTGKPYSYVWNEIVYNDQIRNDIFEDSMKIIQRYLD